MGKFSGSLFSERLIIRGSFAFQNGLGLVIKTALKTIDNNLKKLDLTLYGLILFSGVLIIGRIFASEISRAGGGVFSRGRTRGAYYGNFLA